MPDTQNGRPLEDGRATNNPLTSVTALSLLHEQLIAANIARYVTGQLVAIVADRLTLLRVEPAVRKATLETLRTNMHVEVDRLIDEVAA